MNHTPGPWGTHERQPLDDTPDFWSVDGPHTFKIADVYSSENDARLIAAAPEMVRIVERMLPLLVKLGDFIGNGEIDPQRADSLGERCDVISDARDLLARIEGK